MSLTREEEARVMESLAALDIQDDEYWTTQGDPRVESVATLAGVSSLTRADIVRLAPTFKRGGSLEAEEPMQAPKASDGLAGRLAELDAQIAAQRVAMNEANAQLKRDIEARDRILEQLAPVSNARSNQEAIQQVLRGRQAQARAEAERRNRLVQDYGLTAKDMARMSPSQLDAAMRRNRGFGLSRPKPRTPAPQG